jgi:tetratricopeptide (TPR) repeat protein
MRICQLAEGMPLALELAATWTKILRCENIAAEIERTRDAHCTYYTDFLYVRQNDMSGGRQHEATAEIDIELDNIRSAWQWALESYNVEAIVRSIQTFGQFDQFRSRYREGAALFEKAVRTLESGSPTPEQQTGVILLLVYLGWLYIRLGQLDQAQAILWRCQALHAALGILPLPGLSTDPDSALSIVALIKGDYASATELGEISHQRNTVAGHWYNLQLAHYALSNAARARGEYKTARRHARQLYALVQEKENHWFMAMLQTYRADQTISFDDERVLELERRLRGELIRPTDAGYEDARKLYNGNDRQAATPDRALCRRGGCDHRRRFRARARPADRRSRRWPQRARAGQLRRRSGHRSLDDERRSRRSAESHGARGPGCTQGEVDRVTHAFGLAVPAGIVASTGVAGLTLGGGHGYLTRQHGLTIDNLIEADVVLADGSFVTANASQHQDLFWALRGGGGNFGIVTSFVYRAHPVTTVYAGPIFWDIAHARRIMQWYREFLPHAPEELCTFLGLKTAPSTTPFPEAIWGKKICALISCYNGPAEQAMKPIRQELPAPIFDAMGAMPFPALQSMFDPLLPAGLQWYWKGDFVKELPDAAIDVHLEYAAKFPSPQTLMHLYPIDGAANRVRRSATAWNARDATWSMVIAAIDPDPAKAGALETWAKAYWEAVHPYDLGGAYVNFMMEEGQDRIKATYGDNYERLVAVKNRYDPGNLFRVNQNIKPQG